MTERNQPPASAESPIGRPNARRLAALIAALTWLAVETASGQEVVEVVFSSPPSPVGSGARAAGVGSAFIGLADDATAASWNPGGLTQLERPEISIVGRGIWQVDKIGSGRLETNANGTDQFYTADGQRDDFESISLNYASAAVPFTVAARNVVVSLNYQQMLSFERGLHFRQANGPTDGSLISNSTTSALQTGGIDAATLAAAIEIVPDLSVGAAFNYWLDGLGYGYAWRLDSEYSGSIVFQDGVTLPVQNEDLNTYFNFRGENGNFGLLWKPVSTLAFGATYKLPFTAHVDHRTAFAGVPEVTTVRHRMQFPASYGIGLSYRPDDRLTLTTDLTYVDWNRFRAVDSSGAEFLVTGDPVSDHHVDGVFTPRIGAEYLWLLSGCKLAVRGGAFYDPEPARNSPKSFYGVSAGLGFTFASFSLDFAYQVRFGLDLTNTSTTVNLLDVPDVPTDTFQNLFYGSLVTYF